MDELRCGRPPRTARPLPRPWLRHRLSPACGPARVRAGFVERDREAVAPPPFRVAGGGAPPCRLRFPSLAAGSPALPKLRRPRAWCGGTDRRERVERHPAMCGAGRAAPRPIREAVTGGRDGSRARPRSCGQGRTSHSPSCRRLKERDRSVVTGTVWRFFRRSALKKPRTPPSRSALTWPFAPAHLARKPTRSRSPNWCSSMSGASPQMARLRGRSKRGQPRPAVPHRHWNDNYLDRRSTPGWSDRDDAPRG